MLQFAIKPRWGINYITHERFRLPQLEEHIDMRGSALSIGGYFTETLDPSMNWDDVAEMVRHWNGQFCLKGVMSPTDAKHAAKIGCTGIVVSNHGGRQLDGSRASFDQLADIVDAVGDRIDVFMDGGVQRGTHVLKALSVGAKAAIGKRVTVVDYPDGRLAIRYRGVELAYQTFDKVRQVSQAAIVENKQLGAALAFIRDQQLRREPEHCSDRAPRRRDQHNARLFKVG
jgi:hypothetical protein